MYLCDWSKSFYSGRKNGGGWPRWCAREVQGRIQRVSTGIVKKAEFTWTLKGPAGGHCVTHMAVSVKCISWLSKWLSLIKKSESLPDLVGPGQTSLGKAAVSNWATFKMSIGERSNLEPTSTCVMSPSNYECHSIVAVNMKRNRNRVCIEIQLHTAIAILCLFYDINTLNDAKWKSFVMSIMFK